MEGRTITGELTFLDEAKQSTGNPPGSVMPGRNLSRNDKEMRALGTYQYAFQSASRKKQTDRENMTRIDQKYPDEARTENKRTSPPGVHHTLRSDLYSRFMPLTSLGGPDSFLGSTATPKSRDTPDLTRGNLMQRRPGGGGDGPVLEEALVDAGKPARVTGGDFVDMLHAIAYHDDGALAILDPEVRHLDEELVRDVVGAEDANLLAGGDGPREHATEGVDAASVGSRHRFGRAPDIH